MAEVFSAAKGGLYCKGLWIYPIVAKAEGLQSQGANDEAVANLLRSLGNAGSGALRLSQG